MKPFLVDVPVRIKIWCRPDCQKAQWDVIHQARPSILFILSDGGRSDYEQELIEQNRKMIDESIDWDCKVFRLYLDENFGMFASAHKMDEIIWNNVDRVVLLEDDDIPSVSFFQYCADLLERFKDDQRIECVCGHNYFGTWDECDSDYFFSGKGSIHGIATWKRVRDEYDNFCYYKNKYIMKLLKQRMKNDITLWKKINAFGQGKTFDKMRAGTEFWIEFSMFSQNRLQIIPKHNMINNVGLRMDSAHSSNKFISKKIKKIHNMKTYELVFPLKHPEYVVPDMFFEKKRNTILDYNTPLLFRFVKRAFRAIRILFTDPCFFLKTLVKKIRNKKENEK